MFDNVHTVTTSGASEMFEKLVGVGPEDVVIAFSFPRYSRRTIKALQYAKNQDASVIAIKNMQFDGKEKLIADLQELYKKENVDEEDNKAHRQ